MLHAIKFNPENAENSLKSIGKLHYARTLRGFTKINLK